jgi:glucose/mannose-6-phosphate isomerase
LKTTQELFDPIVETCLEIEPEGHTWIERLWDLILLGDYASIYLAFLNQENPTEIEVIDQLKKRLSDI